VVVVVSRPPWPDSKLPQLTVLTNRHPLRQHSPVEVDLDARGVGLKSCDAGFVVCIRRTGRLRVIGSVILRFFFRD